MKRIFLFSLFILITLSLTLNASVEVCPQAMGMGGAFTAVSDDASSIFWNPARLPLAKKNFSISIPSLSVVFTSNKSRDELEGLEGTELDKLGSLSAKVGVGALVGFSQNQWGIGAIMDLQAGVDFSGEGLDTIKDTFDLMNASPTFTLAQLGKNQGLSASVNMTSEAYANGGGIISYAHKLKGNDLIVGANLKILEGKYYKGNISSTVNMPAAATLGTYIDVTTGTTNASFTQHLCGGNCNNIAYLDDMDGNGFALDVSASYKLGKLGVLEDAYAGVMIRDLFGKINVDGVRKVWGYSTEAVSLNRSGIEFKEMYTTGTVSTDISLSPEIRAGISGRLPESNILIASDLEIDTDDGKVGIHLGLEKSFGWLILRGGLGTESVSDEFSWSMGLGIRLGFFKLDLAYGDVSGGNESGKGSVAMMFEF